MRDTWTMEDAETRLSDIIKAAKLGDPQFICHEGHKEIVIISPQVWENKNLTVPFQPDTNSLSTHEKMPDNATEKHKSFVEALLSMPQGDWDLESSNDTLKLRDVDL